MSLRHMALAVLVALIWGGNFVAVKISVLSFPPLLNTALRFAVAAAVLLPFAPFPKGQAKNLAQLSVTLGTLHFAALAASMWYELDIATCAIAIQMGVPFATILAALLLKDYFGAWRCAGLALCFVGVIIIAGTPSALEHWQGFTLALFAAFFWGYTNVSMRTMPPMDVIQMLAWLAVFSMPLLFGVSLVLEGNPLPILAQASLPAWGGVVYTAISSTIIGYGLWYWLLKRYPVTMIAPFNLLTPIFGIMFGQIFFYEDLGWRFFIGGAITLAGVAIIVLRRPRIMAIGKQA